MSSAFVPPPYTRRHVLRALAAWAGLASLGAFPLGLGVAAGKAAAPPSPARKDIIPLQDSTETTLADLSQQERMVDHLPAIPILMFHKVHDKPRYPEDISSAQLAALFAHAWQQGYRPVNVGDILAGRVDKIIPKGLKPLGITADDSHPSIVFSQATARQAALGNARSFVEIFGNSLQPFGASPRATFFLSGVADDRYSKQVRGYFGNILPLKDVADALSVMPGLELGYHTLTHASMKGMGAASVRALLEEQMRHLRKLGMLDRVARILAYPFGVRPTEGGMVALRELRFTGAVLAFPGVGEGRFKEVPSCVYDGKLMTDAFLLPRVCIGARAYAFGQSATAGQYVNIDPLADFAKDVENAVPRPYISRGPQPQSQE